MPSTRNSLASAYFTCETISTFLLLKLDFVCAVGSPIRHLPRRLELLICVRLPLHVVPACVSPAQILPPLGVPPLSASAPSSNRGFAWPPQDSNRQLVSNATQSAPMYRAPPRNPQASCSYDHRPAEASFNPAPPKWPPQQTFQQNTSTTTTSASSSSNTFSSGLNAGAGSRPAPRRGRGLLSQASGRIPVCATCGTSIRCVSYFPINFMIIRFSRNKETLSRGKRLLASWSLFRQISNCSPSRKSLRTSFDVRCK